MNVGQKVSIKNTLPAAWFNKECPETLNGEVSKVYKNGKVGIKIYKLDKVINYNAADLK